MAYQQFQSNLFHQQNNHLNKNANLNRAGGDGNSNKETALLALMDRTGYPVVQENGQRKYGPPPDWVGLPPQKGCEVFVGKIPRDCYEDELIPVFERIGKIYELRLMMDFSGSNRGYAFLMYTKMEDARNAIQKLNNFEIRPKKFIGVVKSVDNCRLFVGGIPKNKTKEDIVAEMSKMTNGVVNAIVYSSQNEKTRNRGFAFVEYNTHRDAAMARRKLLPGKIQLWGHDIAVDWADPLPEVDDEIMSKVTVLYARNLNANVSEYQLHEVFSLRPLNLKIEKVKKIKDFAFIHYAGRDHAERALEFFSNMNCQHFSDLSAEGQQFEVTWAKPPSSTKDRKIRKQRIDQTWATGFQGTYGMGSPTHTLSPQFGLVFPSNPIYTGPFQSEYSNTLMNQRTPPYIRSSFGNSIGNYNEYLSPASQYLFRGIPL